MKYLTFADLVRPGPDDCRPPLPYSKVQLKRLIDAGKFPSPVKFGGPKSRNHWRDDAIDAHYATLESKT
jgi:hypothetical protein